MPVGLWTLTLFAWATATCWFGFGGIGCGGTIAGGIGAGGIGRGAGCPPCIACREELGWDTGAPGGADPIWPASDPAIVGTRDCGIGWSPANISGGPPPGGIGVGPIIGALAPSED